MNIKEHIEAIIKTALNNNEINIELTSPPSPEMGDFALPCFSLAKTLRKSPVDIAKELAATVLASLAQGRSGKPDKIIKSVNNAGPYLNFIINEEVFLKSVFTPQPIRQTKGEKILLEFSSPNTNKPLHLGHGRNNVLGVAIANLLEATGKKVVRVNLINDRGIHICKSQIAYDKNVKSQMLNVKSPPTPKSVGVKGDHFVGDYYVKFAQMEKENPEIIKNVQECLKKWEADDKETIKLWKQMRKWVLDGFDETYKRLDIKFDKIYYESDTYKLGREIAEKGLKENIFYKREDGAIEIDLAKYDPSFANLLGGGKKVLLRPDGTSIYITQDLGTSDLKFKDYKPNQMLWVTGDEQIYHFKVLFTLLGLLKIIPAEKCHHIPYGMVELPEGKMKSREGTVVDLDDLLDELRKLAKQEVLKRAKVTQKECISLIEDGDTTEYKKDVKKLSTGIIKDANQNIEKQAEKIGQAALKYMLLKVSPESKIIFDPKKAISFEGDTGPYILYAVVRIKSIIARAKAQQKGVGYKTSNKKNYELLISNPKDKIFNIKLIKLLSKDTETLQRTINNYNPSILANYLFDVAQEFSRFYEYVPIVIIDDNNEEYRDAKIALVEKVAEILENGLKILGIKTVEKM